MFEQKVVWIGTVLGDASIGEFEDYFLNELNFHIKYEEEFKMQGGCYEGLNCIVFSICAKEIPKFALFRITTNDMKWLEDLVDNEGVNNFPSEFINKYNDYLKLGEMEA